MKPRTARILLSYLTIYLVWGSNYFAIKLAVQTIPPFTVVGFRFLVGGIVLVGISASQHKLLPLPRWPQMLSSMLVGCLLLIGGNGLITVAQKRVDSYLAALLFAACPMAVMLWDRFILGKKIRPVNAVGVVIGMAGVGFLLYEGKRSLPVLSPEMGFIAAGVILWALGTSLSKKLPMPSSTMFNAALQLTVVGVIVNTTIRPLAPIGAVSSGAAWSLVSAAGLVYLTVFGSIAMVAYAYLLKHEPNHRVVSYVFVSPPLALLLGLVAGKEVAVPFLIPALALLLAGLGLIFYGDRLGKLTKKTRC